MIKVWKFNDSPYKMSSKFDAVYEWLVYIPLSLYTEIDFAAVFNGQVYRALKYDTQKTSGYILAFKY